MNKPLVSVTIPTYNSEKTLGKCLESVMNQTYGNIEVVVVDSFSTDKTVDIAEKFGARVIQTRWKLLGARYLGFKESKGDFILLLDSDQILTSKQVINNAVALMEKNDMLIFEEYTYNVKNWLQKLFEADRKLVHKLSNIHLDPLEGVLLARFYRREILEKAFEKIPKKLFPSVIAHDHAIIYYEAYKVSQNVGILPDAVWHIEPNSLLELLKKNFRYGKSAYEIVKTGYYKDLLSKKVRFRKGAIKDWKLGIQTYILSGLKGVGYYLGYFLAKLDF